MKVLNNIKLLKKNTKNKHKKNNNYLIAKINQIKMLNNFKQIIYKTKNN